MNLPGKSRLIVILFAAAVLVALHLFFRGTPGPESPEKQADKKTTYVNERYGFRIDIPADWRTFKAAELEGAGAVKKGFSRLLIFAAGPDGPGGSILVISLSPEVERYLKEHSWDDLLKKISSEHEVVFDAVSLSSGFEIKKVGYLSGVDYIEDGYFTAGDNGLLRIRFIVRSSKKNRETFLRMRAVTRSLFKVP